MLFQRTPQPHVRTSHGYHLSRPLVEPWPALWVAAMTLWDFVSPPGVQFAWQLFSGVWRAGLVLACLQRPFDYQFVHPSPWSSTKSPNAFLFPFLIPVNFIPTLPSPPSLSPTPIIIYPKTHTWASLSGYNKLPSILLICSPKYFIFLKNFARIIFYNEKCLTQWSYFGNTAM